MSNLTVSVLIVILVVQFLLWILMSIDVRQSEDRNLKWFAIVALFPGIGLFVSSWYFSNRSDLRRGETDGGRDANN